MEESLRPSWLREYKVSVVIPALNEAENLPHVLPRIPSWVHEVVLVDGHSVDDTVNVALRLWPTRQVVNEAADRRQRLEASPVGHERRASGVTLRIVMQERRGKGAALQSGFAAATGDIIVMLDADGSTDPGEIERYVQPLVSGVDFVKGSRFLKGGGTSDMSKHRRLGNWGFVILVRILFGTSYTDLCYGYNAFRSTVLPLLHLNGDGFEIETMMNIRARQAGLKIIEVPSFEAERVHGEGRLRTFPDGWRVLKTIWREWANPQVVRKANTQTLSFTDRAITDSDESRGGIA